MANGNPIRKELRDLAEKAHDRELGLYLAELHSRFLHWREGEISPSELSDLIHEFHDGSARSVYKTYSNLDREQLVARAIGIGLLEASEVSDEIRERLSSSIGFYRDHYEIDEGDPLARLRAARTSGA